MKTRLTLPPLVLILCLCPFFPTNELTARKTLATEVRYSQRDKYPGVTYNTNLGMLSFTDKASFQEVIKALQVKRRNFQYDKGRTDDILRALRNPDKGAYPLLLASSPLSTKVLISFLQSAYPPDQVKAILLANIDFSDAVDQVYQKISLPRATRRQIDEQRFRRAPYDPVFDDFEATFPGFVSFRKSINNAEVAFLLKGGDPESKNNPANNNRIERTIATILNSRKEVQIGRSIYLILPDKDVQIINGDPGILDYVRAHGDVPRNRIPLREPDNGLLIANAPPPVDANIFVQPSLAMRPNGCGVDVNVGQNEQGRIAYSVNPKGQLLNYYWNFDDGYVSYRQAPTHDFADHDHSHTVTLEVYDELGAGCGGNTVVHSYNGLTGTTGCSAYFTTSSSANNASFTALPSGMMPPITYSWDFGDGSFANASSSQVSHTYQSPGQYTVQLTVTDATNCSVTVSNTVAIASVSSASGTSACCDRRDKDREPWWHDQANTHKFKHTLAMHNALFESWFNAEVVTYKKVYVILGNIWWWSKNDACVDVKGTVYSHSSAFFSPSGNIFWTINACANQTPFDGNVCEDAIWHCYSYLFGEPVYVEYNSVTSIGSAFGGSVTASISDCD